MKRGLGLFLLVLLMVAGVACGGMAAGGMAAGDSGNETTSQEPVAPTAPPAAEADAAGVEAATAGAAATACEEFFRFCVTSTLSGAVETAATAGMGGQIEDCAAWVAEGDARILELPMMQGAGEDLITVALTRIGQYTGPGTYELVPVATEGMPDMFPTLVAAGRTFANGEGSAAMVTVAADGSGTVEATGLVEIASIQVSDPDPEARLDFSMAWTCRDN